VRVRIGRYDIVGELARGGMGEILLARLEGPSGFERTVVLKRARMEKGGTDLVSMFLDEARLASRIRHPNVVHVEDLGIDGGLPYLVMEYLDGENVGGVARRLAARGEPMPIRLAAYVVAEACAGLHAAHELVDARGAPLAIVHRDVSPQNVFTTYQGDVKILDFGIASVEGAVGDGRVRGKYAYMAPEQLADDAPDRRVDIFALGVILYELVTGVRLFQRFTTTATVRAVTSDPVVPARRVAPRVPPSLDAICMRALARPRDERYATASAMRRDLLAVMRELGSDEVEPRTELAGLMTRCFADRIEEKRGLLRSLSSAEKISSVPQADVDGAVHIPTLDAMTASFLLGGEPAGASTPRPQSAPSSQSRPEPTPVSRRGTAPSASRILAPDSASRPAVPAASPALVAPTGGRVARSGYWKLEAYLATLPKGIDSYPSCVQKGSIARVWLEAGPKLLNRDALPEPVRALAERPPLPSSWVPEVHANALYLAIAEHFPSEPAFVDFCYRMNRNMMRSVVYRTMARVASPHSFLQAARLGWRLLRRGVDIEIVRGHCEAKISLAWPSNVTPLLVARAFQTSWRAWLEATGFATEVSSKLQIYGRDGATFDVSWSESKR